MYVSCKAIDDRIPREIRSLSTLGSLLKEGDLITPRGELRQELKIFMGGAFFKTPPSPDAELFPWVFSTFDLDRDEERIDPEGWELRNYLKNPVILWAHDSTIPAIGIAEDTAVSERVLGGNIRFNDKDTDPFGWGIGRRVAAGVIRAGSVGFMVNKVEIVEEDDEPTLIFREQELLEFSICNIPSNPRALNRDFPPPEILVPHAEEPAGSFWKGIIRS